MYVSDVSDKGAGPPSYAVTGINRSHCLYCRQPGPHHQPLSLELMI